MAKKAHVFSCSRIGSCRTYVYHAEDMETGSLINPIKIQEVQSDLDTFRMNSHSSNEFSIY